MFELFEHWWLYWVSTNWHSCRRSIYVHLYPRRTVLVQWSSFKRKNSTFNEERCIFPTLMIMLRLVALHHLSTELTSAIKPRLEPPSAVLLSRGATLQSLMHLGFSTLPDQRHPVLFLEFLRATPHVAASCPVRGVCQEREVW